MSKMREAFEKSIVDYGYSIERESDNSELYLHTCTVDAWIGYQAAIAAVREGGPAGYVKYVVGGAPRFVPVIAGVAKIEGYSADYTELYSIPDDLT